MGQFTQGGSRCAPLTWAAFFPPLRGAGKTRPVQDLSPAARESDNNPCVLQARDGLRLCNLFLA
jgi:hypothetical protein